MTDRIKGFTVTLEHDIRIDDVQGLIDAIRLLKGVAHVSPSVTTADDHMNREKIRGEFRNKMVDFFNDNLA